MDDYSDVFINRRLRKHQEKIERENRRDGSQSSIFAEINHKMLNEIQVKESSGEPHLLSALPSGVKLNRKRGARACFFECDDDAAKEDLTDFLDQNGISWQEND
jgi:hypothetical protein